jgi:KaiC/GvpD/RAD55 family RecA-like ATPase
LPHPYQPNKDDALPIPERLNAKYLPIIGRENLTSIERFNIPLLGSLIPGGLKPATILAVEFDPESQWFSMATTMTAKYILSNSYVGYLAMARPREDVIRDLSALGVDVSAAFKSGRLKIEDWYSATLSGGGIGTASGQEGEYETIEGGGRVASLRVADLSVEWLKQSQKLPQDVVGSWPPGNLDVVESCSEQLRFNEEKPYAEWMANRVNPSERRNRSITLQGFVRGLHSEWFYKRMEAITDGVIDVSVREHEGESKSFLRLRSLRGQPYDGRWHKIDIQPNGETILGT